MDWVWDERIFLIVILSISLPHCMLNWILSSWISVSFSYCSPLGRKSKSFFSSSYPSCSSTSWKFVIVNLSYFNFHERSTVVKFDKFSRQKNKLKFIRIYRWMNKCIHGKMTRYDDLKAFKWKSNKFHPLLNRTTFYINAGQNGKKGEIRIRRMMIWKFSIMPFSISPLFVIRLKKIKVFFFFFFLDVLSIEMENDSRIVWRSLSNTM